MAPVLETQMLEALKLLGVTPTRRIYQNEIVFPPDEHLSVMVRDGNIEPELWSSEPDSVDSPVLAYFHHVYASPPVQMSPLAIRLAHLPSGGILAWQARSLQPQDPHSAVWHIENNRLHEEKVALLYHPDFHVPHLNFFAFAKSLPSSCGQIDVSLKRAGHHLHPAFGHWQGTLSYVFYKEPGTSPSGNPLIADEAFHHTIRTFLVRYESKEVETDMRMVRDFILDVDLHLRRTYE